MKMKFIKLKYIALATAFLVASSCTKDFEEINTNPNLPIAEEASPKLLLTNAIESLADRIHSIGLGHEIGSGWVQHMAKVQYTDEDRYIPRVTDINNSWNGIYATSAMDARTIIKLAEKEGNNNFKGVGMVIEAYGVSVLADLFGDVPYEEAFKGDPADGGILSPKYDSQEAVYRKLISNLKEANTLLDPDGEEIAGDILFDNDIEMWKKFANSLRLRLLLRMADRDETFVTAEMTEMIDDDPDTYPILEWSGDFPENAALAYLGSAPNNHPINENRKTRDDHRVSKNIVDMLVANNDPRLTVYASLASGPKEYVGLPNGLTSAAAAAYNDNGLANTSKIGTYFTQGTTPGMFLSYAEQQFTLAEAAERGFITGAGAESYYTDGVWASFYQYHDALQDLFDASATSGQLVLPTTVDEAAEDQLAGAAAWDPANALELIATQKYIALFDQGLQAWFEWRRTDFPVLTPAVSGVNNGEIPVRLTYPLDEETRNPSNLSAAKGNQGGTITLGTEVWWDVN
jgi:hypothetical protein